MKRPETWCTRSEAKSATDLLKGFSEEGLISHSKAAAAGRLEKLEEGKP